MKIYNTLTRKKEEFKEIEKGKVKMYCCGPTVYNYQHIGNLRTYIFEDVLKRILLHNGLKVKHVINITDVGHLTSDADEGEDKMMKAIIREGLKPTKEAMLKLAEKYTEVFKEDLEKLNVLSPDIWPKATEHVDEMIKIIQTLVKKGYGYGTSKAIYFDISKYKDYTKLARFNLEQLEAGARIEPDPEKHNPLDFALWFKAVEKHSNHLMQWNSPWGKGFPGWHIECSAMSMKHLGESFDIHCGGIDHIPVHHTNEIAQSECATGKKWVKYWIHGDFLVLKDGKMSKSKGEFLTLHVLLDKGYDALDYRYFCLGAHYRSQLNFSYEGMDGAKNTLNKLREKIIEFKENKCSFPDVRLEKKYLDEFNKKINDDMNMPEALAITWAVMKDKKLGNDEKLKLLLTFDKILGLGMVKFKRKKLNVPSEILSLLAKREEARKNKNWIYADKYRDDIKSKGYVIADTSKGPVLQKV